jgi:hypothetical protein
VPFIAHGMTGAHLAGHCDCAQVAAMHNVRWQLSIDHKPGFQ